MLPLSYMVVGAVSGTIRIVENVLPISKDAERFINGEIDFEQATNNVIKNKKTYASLTTIKFGCDAMIFCMTSRWIYDVVIVVRSIFKELIQFSFQAFINGIQKSLKHFFLSLQNCSIVLILSEFKYLYDKQKKLVSSISFVTFCNICNQIYFLIIGGTFGFKKTIQIELMKYYLECMGLIRGIAEGVNINFIKYMNKTRSIDFVDNGPIALKDKLTNLSWQPSKDLDIRRTIKVSLEDIFHGKTFVEIIRREIRIIGKQGAETEEEPYTINIEPGCPDGTEFRFSEVGNRDPVNCPADLVVKIETKKHQLYERNGSNLIYTAIISLNDALKGTPIQVPLIDGIMTECNPRGVINTKTNIIIDHAGLPDPTNGGIRGHMIVKFDIEFPDTKLGAEPTDN